MRSAGWVGVDLDGTLARYTAWNPNSVGEPVPLMAERVRKWLDDGVEVRIFTARVGVVDEVNSYGQSASMEFADHQRSIIQDWTEKHFGVRLKVTAQKDFLMMEFWDDRAISVVSNTGEIKTNHDQPLRNKNK